MIGGTPEVATDPNARFRSVFSCARIGSRASIIFHVPPLRVFLMNAAATIRRSTAGMGSAFELRRVLATVTGGTFFSRSGGFLGVLFLALMGCSSSPARPINDSATGVVTLEIDGAGESVKMTVDRLPAGCTVETVMQRAVDQGLDAEITGSGTTAFVASINGSAGSGTMGWLFKVDGEFSERGIGTTELDPPATITWVYADMSAAMR